VEVIKEGILERWRHPCEGRVVSRPLPVGDQLFVSSEDGTLACLNRRTGEPVWKRKNVKSLVAATKRNVLAMDRQGMLVAFDRHYGLPLGTWNATQYSLPVHNHYSDRAYLANGNGMIVAMRDVKSDHAAPTVHFPPKPNRNFQPRVTQADSLPSEPPKPVEPARSGGGSGVRTGQATPVVPNNK
jgi:hypothetical protein